MKTGALRAAFLIFLLHQSLHSGLAQNSFMEMKSPAGANSGQPNFFSARNALYMSWFEGPEKSKSLKISRWDGKAWSAASTVASSVPFFVNWADFPSILALENGTLVSHWLQKSGDGSYSYDVMISTSSDGGKTWSKAVTPHKDRKKAEHGFVSLLDIGNGNFSAVWLDGRNFKSSDEQMHDLNDEMAILYVTHARNEFSEEIFLDKRVCDCCQTSAARTRKGTIVVYRDRSPQEIRDISYVYSRNGKWSPPKNLHPDNWKIAGCPVNGPSVAAYENRVLVVWFTAANDQPRVFAKLSSDSGETFGPAIRIDQGNPGGRVHSVWLNASKAVVSWLENTSSGAEIRILEIDETGKASKAETIAQTSQARSSGFSRLGILGNELFVAWTEPMGETSRIHIARKQIR